MRFAFYLSVPREKVRSDGLVSMGRPFAPLLDSEDSAPFFLNVMNPAMDALNSRRGQRMPHKA